MAGLFVTLSILATFYFGYRVGREDERLDREFERIMAELEQLDRPVRLKVLRGGRH